MLGYGKAERRHRAGDPSQDLRNSDFYEDWFDSSRRYSSTPYVSSQMKEKWRFEEEQHYRDYPSSHGSNYRDRSPPSNPSRKPQSARRGRFNGGRRPSRFARGRGSFQAPRRSYQQQSPSPRHYPEYPEYRLSNFNEDRDHPSRDSSPSSLRKRRRTRSPSPTDWDRIPSPEPQSSNPSRGRERFEGRENWPVSGRALSPHKLPSARSSRPTSRGAIPEVDFYIPSRRHRDHSSPPPTRMRQGRSRSPYRRSSQTPPPGGLISSPPRRSRGVPASSFDPQDPSPHFTLKHKHQRPLETSVGRGKKAQSRTPSIVGDWEEEPMDAPYASRGNYGNPNHGMRGRGQRPYNNHRGNFRGSPPFSGANSSYHGSPQSNASYHGGRGGWDGPSQHGPPQGPNSPPYRQNNYAGAGQSQEEYFQSQMQSQGNHPHQGQSQRPFRGGRGGRGGYRGNYQQQGQDRRFSGPDHQENGPPTRGRGSHYNNLQWTASGSKRGGGPNHPATGPNSVQASPSLSHKGSRASLDDNEDSEFSRPPREVEVDDQRDQNPNSNQKGFRNVQHKDNSKISFAFKSKQPPSAPAKAPPDLNSKVRGPPTAPEGRPPPTQPKAKFFDKKNHKPFDRNERRDFDGPGRPPHPHPSHQHRPKHSPTERRGRSRSPPPKRQKQEPRPKPKLSPEMAASESIYFRKPGNESVIGAGTYGKVFKAIHIYTKDKVALKKIRMEGERDGFPITAVREIKLLQNLRHKHVVALQEVMVEKNECFMVFEYMSHDLTGLINHPTFKLTPAHKKDLGRQMFEGLEFLHRRGVMHRDIKAANLLISHDGQLKYADFGLARFYTKSRQLDYTNRVITIWYRPPELLLGETQYGPSVDIWSAACVFMEMFTKKAIFPGEGGELSQLEKVYGVLGTPTRSEWPGIADLPWYELMQLSERRKRTFEATFESILSPAALDLVKAIFSYDPHQRPNAEEVLQHPYFTEEEPAPQQAYELAEVGGDWHEYESKAHRRENERKEKERKKEEYFREREKRKAKEADLDSGSTGSDPKKFRPESSDLEPGQGEPPPPPQDERAEDSDGEGSARMSMS